jgi:hypothetical protein
MSAFSLRFAAVPVATALFGLTSCSGPAVTVARSPQMEFYWSAAKETYAAGDYMKTADHLDRLIDQQNEYTARAIPWSLVLSAGMAAGYMQLADTYVAGARANKAHALDFRRKASEYRSAASRLTLRFAQNVDKMQQIPVGPIPLAFGMPRGNAANPPALAQVAKGIELAPADVEAIQTLTIQRNVLLAACMAAGAPNDVAKTEELLSQPSANAPRPVFGNAVAQMLESEAKLYSRDKLDDPTKLAIFHQRAQDVLADGAKTSRVKILSEQSAAAR